MFFSGWRSFFFVPVFLIIFGSLAPVVGCGVKGDPTAYISVHPDEKPKAPAPVSPEDHAK